MEPEEAEALARRQKFQSLVRVDWLWNNGETGGCAQRVLFQSLVRVDWLWNTRKVSSGRNS